jgi:hypothetical protein
MHRFDYRHRKMTRLTFFPNETEQSGLPIGKRTLSVFQIAQRKGWQRLHRPIDLPRSAGRDINSLNCSARSPFVGGRPQYPRNRLLSAQRKNTYRELGIDYFDRYAPND